MTSKKRPVLAIGWELDGITASIKRGITKIWACGVELWMMNPLRPHALFDTFWFWPFFGHFVKVPLGTCTSHEGSSFNYFLVKSATLLKGMCPPPPNNGQILDFALTWSKLIYVETFSRLVDAREVEKSYAQIPSKGSSPVTQISLRRDFVF